MEKVPKVLVLATLLAGLSIAIWSSLWPQRDAVIIVMVPELSAPASKGAVLFDQHCAVCHGANAAGSRFGPPLIWRVYGPSHHSDRAFHLAVREGVPSHHWRFGHMPRISGVTENDVTLITQYVRELQRANGIK